MMLKQTAISQDRRTVFFPGNEQSAVELGSYQEMVFQRNTKNKISFSYEWNFAPHLEIKEQKRSKKSHEISKMSFSAVVGTDPQSPNLPVVDNFVYKLENNLSISMSRKQAEKQEYEVSAEGYSLVRNQGRVWPIKSPHKFYMFPEEVVAYNQNADFVQDLNLQHEKLFRSISYLGPLRNKAKRLYHWSGLEPEDAGYGGENTVPCILSAKSRKIAIKKVGAQKASPAQPFEAIIAQKLKDLGLIDDFSVKPISAGRQEYDVKVSSRGSKDFVNLPDVGFGVAQVLPVLVQCFYAPENSIIIMEQPEIHLHPNAQSALADVFIDVINSKENGHYRNIQLIIETHSEHFLRRLQRRIAEGGITEDSVSAYFANSDTYPTKLDPLRIDIFGNITNWPKNFFGDEMGDITSQAQAALKKRKAMIKDNS